MRLALDRPMNQWSAAVRRWAVAGALLFSVVWSLLTHRLFDRALAQPDSSWYLALARGQAVHELPFAGRQLGPAVVRLLAYLLHCSVYTAFHLQGGACLCVVLWIVYSLASKTAAPRWLLAAMVFLPFWPFSLAGLYLPDLWFAALLAVMIWLLYCGRYLGAALMLLPLMASRESTMLITVCLLGAAWRPLRAAGRAVAVAATVAGAVAVRVMIPANASNHEDVSQLLYLIGKVPWNFLRNLLGMNPWSNRYTLLCETPKWSAPAWPGSTIRVGLCSARVLQGPLDSGSPLLLFFLYGSMFSLLTIISVQLWWRLRARRRAGLVKSEHSTMVRFCLLYGAISLLLVPVLGTAMERFVCYAWPLPLIALPAMFPVSTWRFRPATAVFLVAMCCVDVVPLMAGFRINSWVSVSCVFALNLGAFLLFRAELNRLPETAPANPLER